MASDKNNALKERNKQRKALCVVLNYIETKVRVKMEKTGKIGILTFHRATNYGAALQTYGLCKALEIAGKNAEVVDYQAQFIEHDYRLIKWPEGSLKKKIKSCISSLLKYPVSKRRKQAFCLFAEKYLPLSKSVADLNVIQDEYAAFITGSDQVFNREITKTDADAYLLDFVKDSKKKYSYAASMGSARLTEKEEAWFKEKLQDYADISVRESSAKILLEPLLNRPVQVSLDPTLLLRKAAWQELCKPARLNVPYILIYNILKSDKLYVYAKLLSERTGLKVICLNSSLKKRLQYPSIKFIDDASPEEFLGLFHAAKYVVTSSFHGTAFSIIFQKQFASIFPEGNPRNDRVRSLLQITGLENRLMEKANDTVDIDASIDWDKVEKRLAPEREAAYAYLKRIGETVE